MFDGGREENVRHRSKSMVDETEKTRKKAFDRTNQISPANEFVTSTLPPDPTSPSRTPTTRFRVSLATRVWWSTTERSTKGWTVTSDANAMLEKRGSAGEGEGELR